jgi:hypothetical protein
MKDNTISGMIESLLTLRQYGDTFDFDVIHKSFPNGAPDHSNHGYLSIEVHSDVPEEAHARLRELGWHSEQEGAYWCFHL